MAVSPPFTIAETLPANSDLISIYPGQETPYRDTVESWLIFLSDPTTGLIKVNSAFAFPIVLTKTTTGVYMTFESTDAGAAGGPDMDLYRNSASPAAADLLGSLVFNGKDSAGNKQEYARIQAGIVDPVSTTEDAYLAFSVVVNGAVTERLRLTQTTLNVADGLVWAQQQGANAQDLSHHIDLYGATFGINIFGSGMNYNVFTGNNHNFYVGGSLRLTITPTTASFTGGVDFGGAVTSNSAVFQGSATQAVLQVAGAGNVILRPFQNLSTSQAVLTTGGNFSAVSFTPTSDKRLKKNIEPLELDLAEAMVDNIPAVSFEWKTTGERNIGFVAQDVRGYEPSLVQTNPEDGTLGLDYDKMVAVLWKMVKSLKDRVEELEAELG